MKKFFSAIKNLRNKLNMRMRGERMPIWAGICAATCCGILAIIMLFVPSVLGVADDGTVTNVIQGAGLAYRGDSVANPDYFVREYICKNNQGDGYRSIQTAIIHLAKQLDYWVSGDRLFDIRFLGLIYLILFLPAIFLIVKATTERLEQFSEMIVVVVAAVIMFADVGYITYFNSFYPEALIFIMLLYLVGAALSLQKESQFDLLWLVVFTLAGILLCFVRRYCFLAGFLCAIFCFMQFGNQKKTQWKAAVILMGSLLVVSSFGSFFLLKSDFKSADKLHAMSRGVLMQSDNPEKALEEFGIDPSYSLLTDISSYDLYPVTTGDNTTLEEGFYDHYDAWEIGKYYIRHPWNMVSMTDLAVKSNMAVRKDNCSNYEESAGMPAGAKSIFWSAYSIYKSRSAPKTIGYLVVLIIVYSVMTGRGFSLKKNTNRKNKVYFEIMVTLTVMALLQTWYVVVHSGEVAFTQYNNQLGMIMDIMLFMVIAEILDKLNILEKGENK